MRCRACVALPLLQNWSTSSLEHQLIGAYPTLRGARFVRASQIEKQERWVQLEKKERHVFRLGAAQFAAILSSSLRRLINFNVTNQAVRPPSVLYSYG